MAIQDDFTIDYVDRKITYTTAFVDDRPPFIYTVNQLYSFLQDTFDEPAQMDDPVPMSAQTPTQYTLLYPWFMDNESMKALFSGSIQTNQWAFADFTASDGITALRYESATVEPDSTDVGKAVTGAGGATGVILAVDDVRNIVWVRNTSSDQFLEGEVVDDDATGIDPDFTIHSAGEQGILTGDSIWSNLFSVGTLQANTEVYIGQEDDQMGGAAFHALVADNARLRRRIEKIDEWWDTDVDFTASTNGVALGHIDLLVLTQENGTVIDGQRLAVYARQFSTVYSSFELTGGVGNFVVPFASTGADLNAQVGPYNINFDGKTGNDLEVGDVLENVGATTPVGRLRAVVTAVVDGDLAAGDFDYYLIGDTEPLATTDRTLIQLADGENLLVRGDDTDIDMMGAPTAQAPGVDPGGSFALTFADNQVDVDEDGNDEEYTLTIDCDNNLLALVYRRMQFLSTRGNQDGTVADTQDLLLPSAHASNAEAGEFYRSIGDVIITFDASTGTGLSEGDLVDGSISSATGVVISATVAGVFPGTAVLSAVKGTFVNNDVIEEVTISATNNVTQDGAAVSIVDNTAAPVGTFAGGRWFLPQGVVLINVPAADANNWETVDLAGVTRAPPTSRAITFAGLAVNDRATIFEVATAGGIDVVKTQNGVASGGGLGATSFVLDSTVALDVPPSGFVRIVDDSASDGIEFRYDYVNITTDTTVNFRDTVDLTGTTTSAGTSTVLNDTGAFVAANFGTDGFVKVGMEIENDATGAIAVVLRRIDDNSIETTVLSSGTWDNAQAWTANAVVVALDPADTVYFPFIDGVVVSGTELTTTIKFVGTTQCIARARFSDPDVGGTRILPFELTNVVLQDQDLTVTAIRNPDTIATP